MTTVDAGDRVGVWSAPPPLRDRVVVVSPHPDDEVLGSAGLLRWLAVHSVPTAIVAVTDGERSHPRSERITPARLRAIRAAERDEALRRLGLVVPVLRLRLPDGDVAGHLDRLADLLGSAVDGRTTVVAPWTGDGHPDHEATGLAAHRAAAAAGANVVEVLIWARVRGLAASGQPDGRVHRQFRLDADTVAAKAHAADAFVSQLVPLSPGGDPADGPVVHPSEAASLLDGCEGYRW